MEDKPSSGLAHHLYNHILSNVPTDSTGHSALKSSELLKNGHLSFGKKIVWKTCAVCLKFVANQSLNVYPPACPDNQVSMS